MHPNFSDLTDDHFKISLKKGEIHSFIERARSLKSDLSFFNIKRPNLMYFCTVDHMCSCCKIAQS